MVKKIQDHAQEPDPLNVPSRDLYHRLNYMYQASLFLSTKMNLGPNQLPEQGKEKVENQTLVNTISADQLGKNIAESFSEEKFKVKEKLVLANEYSSTQTATKISRLNVNMMRQVAKKATLRM